MIAIHRQRSAVPPSHAPAWRRVLGHPLPTLMMGLAACVLLLSGCLGGGDPAPVQGDTVPAISTQPSSVSVVEGSTASFSVGASGNQLAYQWQTSLDGGTTWADLASATLDKITLAATTTGQDGQHYRVTVSNPVGSITSAHAVLSVSMAPVAPVITSQPTATTVVAPAAARFSIAYTASPAGSVRWQSSTDGVNWSELGVAGNILTLDATSAQDNARQFRAIIDHSTGSVTSAVAMLTVNSLGAPSFVQQPQNATVEQAQSATFTVVAQGTPAPTLAWQESIDGGQNWFDNGGSPAPSASITLWGSAGDTRMVRAIASNSAGDTTSTVATLITTCNAGRLSAVYAGAFPAALPSIQGVFCPQAGNTVISPDYTTWIENHADGDGHGESVGVERRGPGGTLSVVVFSLNDRTNRISWLCAENSNTYPSCTGVTIDGLGKVYFNNVVLGVPGFTITLNGELWP